METLLQDLRYAFRMLVKTPGFTIVAIIALALGIGANTAIFSAVNAILLRPLPYTNPDRIVMIWMDNTRMKEKEDWHSYPNYVDYRDQNQVFEEVAAFNDRAFNLMGTGDPERVIGAWSTANFFSVMGVEPRFGRTFTAEEEEPGRDQVVVLGHGLWQRRFGSDPEIVGQPISINGNPRTVIGIMPPGFKFPSERAEVWVPLAFNAQRKQARGAFSLKAIGRLKEGVTIEQARADMTTIATRLEQDYRDALEGFGVNLVPLHDQTVGKIRPALLVLLGAVGFVLLIACANVANLLLARAASREKELAIRTALGAGRRRIVRQLLTESVMLSLAGGVAGLIIAVWGLDILLALSPEDIPRLNQVNIDPRVLTFTLAVSLATGLIFGLAPALQASRPDLNESLKEGGRGTTAGAHGRRVRSVLVVSEIALSLVLLVGAGLMIKSFMRLQDVDLGFNPDRLLTAQVQLSGSKYGEGQQRAAFFQQLIERIQASPGVQSVGAISSIFLSNTPNSGNFTIEGRPPFPTSEQVEATADSITPEYFQTMGTPIMAGRAFTDADGPDAPEVVIINETFARRFWPDEDPLGKRWKFGGPGSQGPWITIVGIVADSRRTGFDAQPRCEAFFPNAQGPSGALTVVVRTANDPLQLAPTLRANVHSIDPDLPVHNIKTMDELLGSMMSQRRLNMLLFGILAGVALVLAAVGIYGVIAYSVTERTHEIGIRIALGAPSTEILKLVMGQAMLLAAGGVVLGLLAAFALTRVMSRLLYGVSATDATTFVVIAVLLPSVGLLASYIPARRAMKVDPMVALRHE